MQEAEIAALHKIHQTLLEYVAVTVDLTKELQAFLETVNVTPATTPEEKVATEDLVNDLGIETDPDDEESVPAPRVSPSRAPKTEKDVMEFGKHKGKTVGMLLSTNKSYLRWALENIASFKVTDEIRAKLEEGYGPIVLVDKKNQTSERERPGQSRRKRNY